MSPLPEEPMIDFKRDEDLLREKEEQRDKTRTFEVLIELRKKLKRRVSEISRELQRRRQRAYSNKYNKKFVRRRYLWSLTLDRCQIQICVYYNVKTDHVFISHTWMRRHEYHDPRTPKVHLLPIDPQLNAVCV